MARVTARPGRNWWTRRLRGQTAFRAHVGYIRLAAIVLGLGFVYEALKMLPIVAARVVFPFADNLWPESPMYWQLLRFGRGGALYDLPSLSDSFNFGPAYLIVLSLLRAVLGLPQNIVTFRVISLIISLLALVPLAGCAILLARRVGITNRRGIPFGVTVGVAVVLGLAVMARGMTFDSLHPDALLLPLVMSALFVYLGLAEGRFRSARWSWGLVAICLVAAFTKSNAFFLLPVLVAGLYWSGTIERRWAWTLLGTYLGIFLVGTFLMPGPMRSWTVSGPLQIPYEFGRIGNFLIDIGLDRRDIGLLTLLALVGSLLVLHRRVPGDDAMALRQETLRAIIVDGCYIGAVALVGVAAYFKRGGAWFDIHILAVACVPYAATIVATCLRPRSPRQIPIRFQIGVAAILALVILALNEQGQQQPAPNEYGLMANAIRLAHRPCDDVKNRVLVTAFPDLFFTCPNVNFAFVLSWGAAMNDQGFDIIDRSVLAPDPETKYVVWLADPFLVKPPAPWLNQYHLIDQAPVPFGYGAEYYDAAMLQLFQRN